MIKPGRLRSGGVVGVIAPAGVVAEGELHAGVHRLEHLGFEVRLGKSVLHRHRYLAGTDQQRAEDLHRMYADPEVTAIFSARGGSGTGRLIPWVDRRLIDRNPKIFLGSSDLTTFLLYLDRCHAQTAFHGPMVAPHFGREPSPRMEDCLLRLLDGETLRYAEPSMKVLRDGRADGVLTGGCLTLLCASIGTSYEIRTEGRILFIEDTGEAPYKIDRMMSYLKNLGKFEEVRGVIFGPMPGCRLPDDPTGRLEEVLTEILGEYPFPILFGLPSGHGEINLPLAFGILARIDTAPPSLTLLESAVS